MIKMFAIGVTMFIIIVVLALLFAVITQWAWAGSVAQIFHLQPLTFMQAFWLNVLSGMLFKTPFSPK